MSIFTCSNFLVNEATFDDRLYVNDRNTIRRIQPTDADIINPAWKKNLQSKKCLLPFHPQTLSESEGETFKFSTGATVYQLVNGQLHGFGSIPEVRKAIPDWRNYNEKKFLFADYGWTPPGELYKFEAGTPIPVPTVKPPPPPPTPIPSICMCSNFTDLNNKPENYLYIKSDTLKRIKPHDADVLQPNWRSTIIPENCSLPFHPKTLIEMNGDVIKFSDEDVLWQVRGGQLYNISPAQYKLSYPNIKPDQFHNLPDSMRSNFVLNTRVQRYPEDKIVRCAQQAPLFTWFDNRGWFLRSWENVETYTGTSNKFQAPFYASDFCEQPPWIAPYLDKTRYEGFNLFEVLNAPQITFPSTQANQICPIDDGMAYRSNEVGCSYIISQFDTEQKCEAVKTKFGVDEYNRLMTILAGNIFKECSPNSAGQIPEFCSVLNASGSFGSYVKKWYSQASTSDKNIALSTICQKEPNLPGCQCVNTSLESCRIDQSGESLPCKTSCSQIQKLLCLLSTLLCLISMIGLLLYLIFRRKPSTENLETADTCGLGANCFV